MISLKMMRKEQMMSSAKIWCEVFCDHCGGVVGRYFKNIDTISWLKNETSDLVVVDEGLQLCPSCYTKFIGADNEL